MSTKRKQRILFWARCFLSLLLVYLLFRLIKPMELAGILLSANLSLVLIALGWLFLDRILMAYRLVPLLRHIKIQAPFWNVVKVFFTSSFAGNVLPSSMAPDALRIYMLSKYGDISKIFSVILVDRVIGLFSQMAVVMIAFVLGGFLFNELSNLTETAAAVAFLGFLVCLAFLIVTLKRSWMRQLAILIGYSQGSPVLQKLKIFYDACYAFKDKYEPLLRVLGVSFINHIGTILMVYILARGVFIEVPLLHFFILIPVIHLLAMLPISLNGVGIQEGAYVVCFTQLGVPVQESLALSLILRALMIFSTFPGIIFFAREDLPSARIQVLSRLSLRIRGS